MKIICKDGSDVSIEFLPDALNIGIMLSGGMDSALLLFLLLKEKIDINSAAEITAFTVPNIKDNAAEHSLHVIRLSG